MTLTAKYQRFLASPTADALAEKATLNYITTLSSYNEPIPILKHLVSQGKQLEKKTEKVLSAIDSGNAICIDMETTLEFKTGGGAFLPGLDDNFLADRAATIPIVHIVHFDEAQKITQIRQYWDQGSLLKQIEVIGVRGKNWPIRDAKDMVKLIVSSASVVPQASTDNSRPSTSGSQNSDGVTISQRPSSSRGSSISATRDPHASLSLFAPREIIEEEDLPSGNAVPTRQSARPAPRDLNDLFVGENSPESTAPSRKNSIPAKIGAGKKWGKNRLFDDEHEEATASPQKSSIKTETKKYEHFEFGDGEDTPVGRARAPNMKHQSQWDFEDFVTPAKVTQKVRDQDVRHFGWSDDEDGDSPVRRPVIHQARPNLKAQFEFEDDGTPEADKQRPTTSKGRAHNSGIGLYEDHVIRDDAGNTSAGNNKQPLSNVTAQFNNESRKKDFGSQWEMKDDSPAVKSGAQNDKKPVADARQKVIKNGLDSHWSLYDESPKDGKTRKIYNTAGNGMGGRSDASHWNIAEEEPADVQIRGRKQGAQGSREDEQSKENVPRKIYNTTGDGMGGRKDNGSHWHIAEEEDPLEQPIRGRKQPAPKQEEKSFWDF